jgi:SAM-dependent methyltransferase
MHENSRLLFEKYARGVFRPHMRVLEIGPDATPSTYQKVVSDPTLRWETLDIRKTKQQSQLSLMTHVAENEYEFPIPDDSYDAVLSGQVMEHVRKVWIWFREVTRVCRRGGTVITICPVTWPYHEDPVDCWRVYPEGMKALCDEAGLEPLLIACESVEPPVDLRRRRWFLTKQVLKAYAGREPFLAPLEKAWIPTLDTISIARKP